MNRHDEEMLFNNITATEQRIESMKDKTTQSEENGAEDGI